jgi:hypothetical protein
MARIRLSGHGRRAVPLYYFNLYNDDVTMDYEGVELAGPEAAHAHALMEARHMAADAVSRGHFTGSHRVEFVDGERNALGEVRFDEAVEIRA